jgi:hypothetical protein
MFELDDLDDDNLCFLCIDGPDKRVYIWKGYGLNVSFEVKHVLNDLG